MKKEALLSPKLESLKECTTESMEIMN